MWASARIVRSPRPMSRRLGVGADRREARSGYYGRGPVRRPQDRPRRLSVERVANGTNLARLTFKDIDPAVVSRRLAERGIRMPGGASGAVVTLAVNETWNRATAPDLARAFEEALAVDL